VTFWGTLIANDTKSRPFFAFYIHFRSHDVFGGHGYHYRHAPVLYIGKGGVATILCFENAFKSVKFAQNVWELDN